MQLIPGPEYFQVSEIPAYPPCGQGEHLYLRLRKRNCSTPCLVTALAAACGCHPREVGYAGRKDRHAITEQDFSLRGIQQLEEAQLQAQLPPGARVDILSCSRHTNKLRIGHLRGNRFRLGIAGISDWPQLKEGLARVAAEGFLNLYGAQRYGRDQANLQRAQALAQGQIAPPRQRRQRQYLADAAQAAIFDAVARSRQAEGLERRLCPGDIAMCANGACFLVREEELAETQQRCAAGLISCSGPLPGSRLLQAGPPMQEAERRWSESVGISWDCLQDGGCLASRGDRRRLWQHCLEDPQLSPSPEQPDQAWISFALPPGSYATTLCEHLGIACRNV